MLHYLSQFNFITLLHLLYFLPITLDLYRLVTAGLDKFLVPPVSSTAPDEKRQHEALAFAQTTLKSNDSDDRRLQMRTHSA